MDGNIYIVNSDAVSSVEDQLKDFGDFLGSYDTKLCKLLSKAEDCVRNSDFVLQNSERVVSVKYSTDRECLPLVEMFHMQKEQLPNKMILTFGFLCNEAILLVENVKEAHLQFLYLDEEFDNINDAWSNTMKGPNGRDPRITCCLLKISNTIEFLCKIKFMIQSCLIWANHLVHQCGALFSSDGSTFSLFDVIDCLAEIILRIKISDEILSQSNFSRFWIGYKKALGTVTQFAQQLAPTSEINGLLNWMAELDFLFSGTLFQDFLKSTKAFKDDLGAKALEILSRKFNEYIKHQLNHIESCTFPNTNEPTQALLVRTNVFTVFCHGVCFQVDAKHLKHLLLLNAKHPVVTLIGNIIWKTETFLQEHGRGVLKSFQKFMQHDNRQVQKSLNLRMATLQTDCKSYFVQISQWLLLANKSLRVAVFDMKVEQFNKLAAMLLQGLQYMGQVGFLIKELVRAHISLQVPMAKTTLSLIYKLIEMMTAIQLTFQQNYDCVSKMVQCILQHLQYEVYLVLMVGKSFLQKKVLASTRNDCHTYALAGLKIAEECLNGPATKRRILVMKLTTNFWKNTLNSHQDERLTAILEHIQIFLNFQEHLKNNYDASFIAWHKSMLSSYLEQVVERSQDFNSLQFINEVMNACDKDINHFSVTASNAKKGVFRESNFATIRKEIISNLCAQIETYLRLEVHLNLHLDSTSHIERIVNECKSLIEMGPLEVNGNFVIFKYHMENYLSTMFYNLTTITLHDWKTYEEMRQVAKVRLNLMPVENYLPNHTLEQGVDILEIMHNIEVFVSKCVYNMHTQVFVEQQSGSKHLHVIGIRHITNSLRTHGTGIINTTINYTYQFLRQKFYTFSQFLYDEQIKARIMKELRLVSERKRCGQNPLFSYERAEAFNKDIRNLGLSSDGHTFMDLFRKVITQIGNAMGYVRLVRSGSIHTNYSAGLFLPRFEGEVNFLHKSLEESLQYITINAAENLEINIKNLSQSFSDGADFLKILINAFRPFFTNPNNIHLKVFYLIIPALTLNYVEYILSAREKLKTEKNGPLFFDDGFSVGLTFLLKLLNQIGDFNSLQWFVVVRNHFDAECRKIKAMDEDVIAANRKTGTVNAATRKVEHKKLQQTLALTERRIQGYQAYFHLLYCNLCSAKILFQ